MSNYSIPDPKNFESTHQGKNTHLFILKNSRGMHVAFTDYGARIVSILVPDKNGDLRDVVLGFNSIQEYYDAKEAYHGATIGRFANRIANGKFKLGDQEFTLATNNGPNALHGGPTGFHNQVWNRRVNFENKVDFIYTSEDAEEGYPGKLTVHCSYELTEENELIIRYQATTDKPTIVNLTNHAYFNLDGEDTGSILEHLVSIPSEEYLTINEFQIPTQKTPVENTPFDFRKPKRIGESINSPDDQLTFANGYDHSFIHAQDPTQPCATAIGSASGIKLEVFTTYPGVHLYSGNFLNSIDKGKQGTAYQPNDAFCLECQFFPDSANRKDFPSCELLPNETFKAIISYKFGISLAI
ncbi:aldose epimerase family protein [Sphingobacterium hungaricum]|uniref:Aldose 1-epimerase n=1 Tax=Sphingobacterium hungaricum TaxID=2082723 RepID=A0A928UV57_9SPHI|nr:aldose epimerase family protein [Sphingobacterium hungaricum]MBE8713302.1 galactose-1-epimerase [Sphingobacterium hungaricum]